MHAVFAVTDSENAPGEGHVQPADCECGRDAEGRRCQVGGEVGALHGEAAAAHQEAAAEVAARRHLPGSVSLWVLVGQCWCGKQFEHNGCTVRPQSLHGREDCSGDRLQQGAHHHVPVAAIEAGADRRGGGAESQGAARHRLHPRVADGDLAAHGMLSSAIVAEGFHAAMHDAKACKCLGRELLIATIDCQAASSCG